MKYVSQFHAKVFEQSHPRATEAILKSTYMDNSIDSVVDEIEGTYKIVHRAFRTFGMFTLRWLCDSSAVLKEIPPTLQDGAIELELDLTAKIPGLLQKMCLRTFNFKIVESEFQFTKRVFLRQIAILYDSLG